MATEPQAKPERGIADPDVFEDAFEQHFASVYRFIARRVGTDLAEDLAAEVFVTAYQRRTSFRPGEGGLRSWLYGIAVNVVRNHWRAERRFLDRDARLVTEAARTPSSDAIDQREVALSLGPALAAALRMLSDDQRDVVLLHAWAELSSEEIAAALDVPPGTVRSRLSRARALLREQLGRFDRDLWRFERSEIGSHRGGQDDD